MKNDAERSSSISSVLATVKARSLSLEAFNLRISLNKVLNKEPGMENVLSKIAVKLIESSIAGVSIIMLEDLSEQLFW